MIEAEVWLPQIVGYCKFIADDCAVKKAWLDHDLSETSVSSFDEMYEQIFDDLDADGFDYESLNIGGDGVEAIKKFMACLRQSDEVFISFERPGEIIKSRQWGELKKAASVVLESMRQR